jgi:xanthine dehydrogenase accessory factor
VVLAAWLESGTHRLLVPGDELLAESARDALLDDRAGLVESDTGTVFLRPHNPPARVIIVGAAHVTQSLVPLAVAAGFDVVVVDPRTAFATAERFPGVRLVRSWPREALAELGLDHRSAVVTVTHDPKLDDPALLAALEGAPFYIGALGSRRTHASRLERLAAAGADPAALARIHAPVGLDIGARTTQEISVSIIAEIVQTLRRRASRNAPPPGRPPESRASCWRPACPPAWEAATSSCWRSTARRSCGGSPRSPVPPDSTPSSSWSGATLRR